jgi:predicted nucleic acid-binding Zn ribbon protein
VRPGPKKGAKYKRRKKLTGKKCATCGKTYSGLLSRGRYCSSRCRDTAAKRRQRRKDLLRRLSWTSDLPDEVLDDLAAITEMASCNDMLGDKQWKVITRVNNAVAAEMLIRGPAPDVRMVQEQHGLPSP